MRIQMDINELSNYIFDWMLKDIQREIDLAKSGKDAGNVLCALGLMAYTEFMGSLMPTMKNEKCAKNIFNEFFRFVGADYSDLIDKKKINIYDIFRCGLAHEYFIKGTCTIAMLNSTEGEIEVKGAIFENNGVDSRVQSSKIKKPIKCGIVIANNGSYLMIIEKYYEDFKIACEKLTSELRNIKAKWTPPKNYSALNDSG